MLNIDNNELYYPHPDGTIHLGSVVSPPAGKLWPLCTIKIEDGHYGIYTGEVILKTQLKHMES